jgi:hypothetical protein
MLTTLAPAIAFAINVVVQVASYRLVSRLNILGAIFAGFGAGLLALIVLSAYDYTIQRQPPPELISLFIVNLVTFSALGYGYFHFINLGVTARRIRLLIELMESEGGLAYEEILQRYNAREMVDNRLGRLLDSGQVLLKEGKCFIGKPVMLLMAKAMVAMKLLVLGKRSEFH